MNFREISFKSIVFCLLEKIWVVILAAFVFGTVAFFVTEYLITPQYRASIRLYVNNKTEATNLLTSGDVSAAKSLVDTYITILKSDSVVDDIAKRAKYKYTTEQIKRMMTAKAVNSTEVFDVSIIGSLPEDCALIANFTADIAPNKISKIVDGSSVKIIDRAKIPIKPISPSKVRNVAVAGLLGIVLSCVAIVLMYLLNTSIYSEEDIKEFCDLPILGVFPNLNQTDNSEYGNSYGGRRIGSE